MKKLLFVLCFFISFAASSQNFLMLLDAKLTANTTGALTPISSNSAWSVQLVWSGATGTVNATVYIEVSNDGVNYTTYASNSYKTISGASGVWYYDQGSNGMAWRFIRARYVKNGCTSATIKVYFNQLISR